jgi:predicted component of type VI protein secretion system
VRKLLASAVIVGSLLGITSCSSSGPEEQENWSEVTVKLKDGRSINCLIWIGYRKGGPSCDWANAK